MDSKQAKLIAAAKKAALDVLKNNRHGPFDGLPRTAGWGYPEPYTRDLLLSILGIAKSNEKSLIDSVRKVLETLADNQTEKGHIPSLVHDNNHLGASDTTPLFLLAVGIYRQERGDPYFLSEAVEKAYTWMEYQSPSDRYLIAQQPTSDWRDELWVYGYGLYVNCLSYCYLSILGHTDKAALLRNEMNRLILIKSDPNYNTLHESLEKNHTPYYACWSYKTYRSIRFDLLGNSLAILSGISTLENGVKTINWVEQQILALRENNQLKGDLPPNFFPYIRPGDEDWMNHYELYNKPGNYHNGGIWPFICSLYIAALVSIKKYELAEKKLIALTQLITMSKNKKLSYGFNEWHKAQNGKPMGEDWQTWSASLYSYAVTCVEEKRTPYFEGMREKVKNSNF